MLVTTGILAATTGVEPGGERAPRAASLPMPLAAMAEPAYYFDDATDALAERGATRLPVDDSGTTIAGGIRTVSGVAPQASTNMLLPDDGGSADPRPPTPSAALAAAEADGTGISPVAGLPPLLAAPPALVALRQRAAVPDGATEVEVAVGPGDTLSGILNEHGVRIDQMPALLADDVVTTHLSRLKVGQRFAIAQFADGRFHSLSAKLGHDTRITIRHTDEGFAAAAIDLPVEKERVVTSGTIEQSLYLAAEAAELKQSTIMALADIFQWELDFARDIRKGDHFAVVYDRLYREGMYIGDGDILAAEFERGGRTHRAIRFTDDDGRSGYYAPDGTSKRRTFSRHPVDVVRITSKFDPNRLHPVLHQIRAHRGVDYGAAHGSPVRATADGIVRFSGAKSSYGNTVILQHGQTITTLYAHLSRISDKSVAGTRVRQGDVIGYVGNTGRVTGTHLHYEFRVTGEHVNPLTVEFPAAAPLQASNRDALETLSDELIAQMRSVSPYTKDERMLASDSPLSSRPDAADMLAAGGANAGDGTESVVALTR